MIGLIIADKHELNKIKWLEEETISKNGFEFTIYEVNENKVVVAHSGIGIVKAAACVQEMISSFGVKKIFNYGAVGADSTLEVFDLIVPKKIYFHDVITPWYPRGQVPGDVQFYINHLRVDGLKNNPIASGMKFITSEEEVKEIQKELVVSIFDMETAGMAQIAYNNDVELHVLKCVSDIIGKDSSRLGDINYRIGQAGKLAFDKTIELINNLNK
ncbi:hypothetical protein MYMA111404_03855 [Mycoplasma marinum]|uniref:Nucleoside phosphorylase domain-containing protein n=1 Tax=Mycoplasma marinum TaxID=1937190 RepID=A0A4R0XJI5_9MOLU|nr:hypothetical protein [Mycoplasma marinum]TCG10783.1 hypothetical protein C4B24_03870 [Mycoplasma marinum]